MNIVSKLPFFLSTSIGDLKNLEVVEALSISDFLNDLFRNLMYGLYWFLSMITDLCETIFLEIMNFDFLTVLNIAGMEVRLDELTWTLLGLTLAIIIILKMLSFSGDLSWLRGIITVTLALSVFSSFYTLAMDFKQAGVVTADQIVNREELSISKMIFYENTTDMELSVSTDTLSLMNRDIDINYINPDEVMSKDTIGDKITYSIDGVKGYESLIDGIGGFGDERYYRWETNYFGILLTMLVIALFYLLGGYKIAYIAWDLVMQRLTGKCVIAVSVSNVKRIATVFVAVMQSVFSLVFTYFSMNIFALAVSGILKADMLIFSKIIVIIAMGMTVVLGSYSINKTLDIDDGSGFLMKSLFAGRSLMKMGKSVANGVKGLADKAGEIGEKTIDYGKEKYNESKNNWDTMQAENDQVNAYNEVNQQPLGIGYDENMENQPIYGSNDVNPETGEYQGGHFHAPDTTDSYNEKMEGIKEDFMQKYNEHMQGTANNHMQSVDMGAYKTYSQYKEDYLKGDKDIYKQSSDMNNKYDNKAFNNADKSAQSFVSSDMDNQFDDKSFNNADKTVQSLDYDKKSYSQYKRDYENGNTSVEKPYSPRSGKMPSWYIDDDPPTRFESKEFNREEYYQKLAKLGYEKKTSGEE